MVAFIAGALEVVTFQLTLLFVMTSTDVSTTSSLMMTCTQVVETSVNVITNSPSQDYNHPDGHTLPTYDMTPGFKPV